MRNTGSDPAPFARRFLVLVFLLIPLRGIAQSAPQSGGAALQVPVLLKVLTYDRHFEAKAGLGVVVGIVYVAGDQLSLKAAEDVGSTFFGFKGKTLKKVPVSYEMIEYKGAADLEKTIKAKHVNVLYITPGNDKNLVDLVKVSQANSITTVTGTAEYVKSGGIAIGVGLRQDNKPQIHINLHAAKAEGSEFDASLLQIAEVHGK
jgi:YfiR/HmsC-like